MASISAGAWDFCDGGEMTEGRAIKEAFLSETLLRMPGLCAKGAGAEPPSAPRTREEGREIQRTFLNAVVDRGLTRIEDGVLTDAFLGGAGTAEPETPPDDLSVLELGPDMEAPPAEVPAESDQAPEPPADGAGDAPPPGLGEASVYPALDAPPEEPINEAGEDIAPPAAADGIPEFLNRLAPAIVSIPRKPGRPIGAKHPPPMTDAAPDKLDEPDEPAASADFPAPDEAVGADAPSELSAPAEPIAEETVLPLSLDDAMEVAAPANEPDHNPGAGEPVADEPAGPALAGTAGAMDAFPGLPGAPAPDLAPAPLPLPQVLAGLNLGAGQAIQREFLTSQLRLTLENLEQARRNLNGPAVGGRGPEDRQ